MMQQCVNTTNDDDDNNGKDDNVVPIFALFAAKGCHCFACSTHARDNGKSRVNSLSAMDGRDHPLLN
jgi:hypothetical protein